MDTQTKQEKAHLYYLQNKERLLNKCKKYYYNNRNKLIEYQTSYNDEHKDKIRNYNRKYYKVRKGYENFCNEKFNLSISDKSEKHIIEF
jgi:hypothetical protein